MTDEKGIAQSWYAIVYAGALRSYLDHYSAMEDPKLEAMPSEGPDRAKLSSSLFVGENHEDIAQEALRLVQILSGAAKIKEGPGNLNLLSVVAIYADGTSEKFPAIRVHLSVSRHYTHFIEEGRVKETFEKSVVVFALRYGTKYPQVIQVLRTLAQSDDWLGLCRVFEIIRDDLNANDPQRKKNGYEKVVQRGWVTKSEMDSYKATVALYRHPKDDSKGSMMLDAAQNFIGRIIEGWLYEIAARANPPTTG